MIKILKCLECNGNVEYKIENGYREGRYNKCNRYYGKTPVSKKEEKTLHSVSINWKNK